MTSIDNRKVIFVVGATGIQGTAVVHALLAPSSDGSPSPWRIRALSRNLEDPRAKKLEAIGVEFIQGSFTDYAAVERGMTGAYGAYVNTDATWVGTAEETQAGIRIYEIAQRAKVRHYVWAGLAYVSKKTNWDPQYRCEFFNSKGRVNEFLLSQPSDINTSAWTVLLSGPYMEQLKNAWFAPLNVRSDGTLVFAGPMHADPKRRTTLVALSDIGWWARYVFDTPQDTAGKLLAMASDEVSWPELVETFKRVTGKKAEFVPMTMDEFWELFENPEDLVRPGEGSNITFRQEYSAALSIWRDDHMSRDMAWVRKVHPGSLTLEEWMRKTGYDGVREATKKMTVLRANVAKMQAL